MVAESRSLVVISRPLPPVRALWHPVARLTSIVQATARALPFYSTTYPHRHPAHGRVAMVSAYRPPNVGGALAASGFVPSVPRWRATPPTLRPALACTAPSPLPAASPFRSLLRLGGRQADPTRPFRSLSGLAASALIGCLHLYQGAGTLFVG